MYKRNIEAHSRNRRCEKAISIMYFQCVSVALVIQRAKFMCHIIYCHPWPVWLYGIFPHYLINGPIFRNMLSSIKHVFWFALQILSETFLMLRTERDNIYMYIGLHVKYPLSLSDSNTTSIFLKDFWKILKYQISWKSVEWGPICSTWTDQMLQS